MTPEPPDDDRTVIRPPAAPSSVPPMPPVPSAGPAAPGPSPAQPVDEPSAAPGEEPAAPAAIPASAPAAFPAAPAAEYTHFDATQFIDAPRPAAAGAPAPAPAPTPTRPDMGNGLPIGTRLGEFELVTLVGEGGFGLVYLATDHSLQRRVALKEYMPSALAARTGASQVQVKSERYRETFDAGLKSFINEARLLASFDHPSLVKVYRFWEANGTAYMVMPFLDGQTLKDVLRGMPSRPDEEWLMGVLGPLTEALQVIHAEQCYHRDIAPDNVMLLPNGRWLLLDFGAARRVIGDMTQALTVILKPGYAPVEQYAEIPGMKQGPWTDVYALAAVVHYAVMGKTPPPSVGRLLNDTYVPLVQAAAGRYSERLLAAVDRALAVRPEMRSQSIGEFRSDLGLGGLVFDPYVTKPLPPGVEHTQQRPAPPPFVAPAPGSAAGNAPRPAAAPLPAARSQGAQGPATATPGGNKAMLGIGIGVAVLAVLAVGGYLALAPVPTSSPATAPAVAAAPSAAPAPVIEPAPAPTAPAPTAPPVLSFDPPAELQRVVQAQSPGYDLRLLTSKAQYRIGRDELSFTVQSQREGFVYVFVHGADGVLLQLFPNARQRAPKVRPGQILKLPPAGVAFVTAAPAGVSELLVMVSALPRDHSAMQPRGDDYREFPTGAAAALLAAQIPGPVPPMAGRAVCPASGDCDQSYGAALVRVEAVP